MKYWNSYRTKKRFLNLFVNHKEALNFKPIRIQLVENSSGKQRVENRKIFKERRVLRKSTKDSSHLWKRCCFRSSEQPLRFNEKLYHLYLRNKTIKVKITNRTILSYWIKKWNSHFLSCHIWSAHSFFFFLVRFGAVKIIILKLHFEH